MHHRLVPGMSKRVRLLFLGALATLGAHTQAAVILVPNGSFEEGDVADGSRGGVTVWSTSVRGSVTLGVIDSTDGAFPGSTGNGAALPGTAEGGQFFAAAHGSLRAAFNLTSASFGTIAPLTSYTLTVAVGDGLQPVIRPSYSTPRAATTTISLRASDGVGGFTLLASGVIPSSGYAENPTGTFSDFSFTYVSGDVTDPNIGRQFNIDVAVNFGGSGAPNQSEVQLDNFRLWAEPVPEPGNLALGFAGTVFLLGRRHSRPTPT